MATQRCPICGVSVKSENLARHLEAQHPRDAKATAAREKIRRQPAPRAAKPAGRRIRLGRFHYLAIAVVVLVILAIYLIPRASVSQFDVVNSCGAEGFAEHYHPLLIINDHGTHQHLPYDSSQGADIGYVNRPGFTNKDLYCSYGQLHAMHTHDGSGIIHIEFPVVVSTSPTLGQFFTIWGEPLSPSQVWTYSGTVSATSYDVAVNRGTDYSSSPGSIPLVNTGHQYSIPAAMIFNGQYGNGASSGYFSGQIIWLNVTG